MTNIFVRSLELQTQHSTIPAVIVREMSTQEDYIVISLQKDGKRTCFVTDLRLLRQQQHWNVDDDGYAGGSIDFLRVPMHRDVYSAAHSDYTPSINDDVTLDHINTLKFDNRLQNLRLATKSEQSINRDIYSIPQIPEDMKNIFQTLGESKYPRSIYFDASEDKFTFSSHMFSASFSGTSTGTKSSRYSHMSKFVNILEKYIKMLEENLHLPLRPSAEIRKALTEDVYRILHVANTYDSSTFPLPRLQPDIQEDDLPFAKRLIEKFKPFADEDIVTLAKKLNYDDIYVPEDDIYVRLKGINDAGVVFDTKHAAALAKVNWDADDLRIHVSPKLISQFPSILQKLPKLKKINLKEFVFVILEGNAPILPTQILVPYNCVSNDVRAANIKCITGSYRSYKPSNMLLPNTMNIGFKYLPKGVKLTTDSVFSNNKETKYIFVVTPEGQNVKKISFRIREAKNTFMNSVVPLLQADWFEEHKLITASLTSYYNAL